ncbi:hypothetical protein L873DRAFT_1859876, partial [Choiromyces venosus 120613-1]
MANYWGLNSFKSRLRLGLLPIGGYYMVTTLLGNILVCINSTNQVPEKYYLLHLCVEDYLYI